MQFTLEYPKLILTCPELGVKNMYEQINYNIFFQRISNYLPHLIPINHESSRVIYLFIIRYTHVYSLSPFAILSERIPSVFSIQHLSSSKNKIVEPKPRLITTILHS